jgi:imidazoleglycerol-phosphate dehydratase/histidinol-phosphatase
MPQKVLFIDRDGTLIVEPPEDYQIDSLKKLEYLPGVFRNMYRISRLTDYKLVIVSNQDGLGTDGYPQADFDMVQEKFLKAFANEGIVFDEILIDPSMLEENSPNRKPGTGMLKHYLEGDYDLDNSFVIGDRLTDIELAKNLGAKGILIREKGNNDSELGIVKEIEQGDLSNHCDMITDNWDDIGAFVRSRMRTANVTRNTKETQISIELALDGDGNTEISTGLGFFEHMLEQIARHGGFDMKIKVSGDLQVDEHHTVEDTALALGEAFSIALGNKKGVQRYGFTLPMDDCLAQVALDFGGRPWTVWEAEFKREYVGDVPTELFFHFFKSFSDAAKANINIKAEGDNEHHKIEAIFKAFAKSLKQAVALDEFSEQLPSTKGML